MDSIYNCTQDELYEGCDLLHASLVEELTELAAFKAKYTATFATAFAGLITTAVNMPDEEQRAAQHEVMRIDMRNKINTDFRVAMGSLRLYIRDAYPNEEVYTVRLAEAGFNDYEKAMKYNWEKVKAILRSAKDFIANHLTELTANNNMPAGFQTTITDMKTAADSAIVDFLNERENSKQESQDKVAANNALYKAAIAICEDGYHVFFANEAKRSQFVWDSIMTIVSPPGVAGLRLDVKENETNLPLEGVTVMIQPAGGVALTQVTDAEGKAFFASLEAGNYRGNLSLTGYVTLHVGVEITTGVTSFKHWLMVHV